MNVALSVIFFVAAIGGVVAACAALRWPGRRFEAYVAATVCFGIAGLLALASIGFLILALAVISAVGAQRSRNATPPDQPR